MSEEQLEKVELEEEGAEDEEVYTGEPEEVDRTKDGVQDDLSDDDLEEDES